MGVLKGEEQEEGLARRRRADTSAVRLDDGHGFPRKREAVMSSRLLARGGSVAVEVQQRDDAAVASVYELRPLASGNLALVRGAAKLLVQGGMGPGGAGSGGAGSGGAGSGGAVSGRDLRHVVLTA